MVKRLPKGLKRLTKEEFVNKTLAFKEERELMNSFHERVGVDWAKINEKTDSKRSIRW